MKKIAIVGRPNVGKSTLFNRIVKKRISIVDEEEGITRDRIYGEGELLGEEFTVIDTGGLDEFGKTNFSQEINIQAKIAIEEADVCILVVDVHVGLTDLDRRVGKFLLKTKKPTVVAVNKFDSSKYEDHKYEFFNLGISDIISVSATHGYQIFELLEKALEMVSRKEYEEQDPYLSKVGVIGRPNVGKSTLINALLDEKRVIESPIPGTTRDSIEVVITTDKGNYQFIDTAGIRRKNKEKEVVEKFAHIRTDESIEKSQICLFIIDAEEGLTHQDKKILQQIHKAKKGCILVINKWDLIKDIRMEHTAQALRQVSPFIKHMPLLFISAKDKRNLNKIFDAIDLVYQERNKKLKTHELNCFFQKTLQKNNPPMIMGKRLRIYYATQMPSASPTFVLFINNKKCLTKTYIRYLINQFRETYSFSGCPINIILKDKSTQYPKNRSEHTEAVGSGLCG